MPDAAGIWIAAGRHQFLATAAKTANPFENLILALIDSRLLLDPLLPHHNGLSSTDMLAQDVQCLSQFGELLLQRCESRAADACAHAVRLSIPLAVLMQVQELAFELSQQIPLQLERGIFVRSFRTDVSRRIESQSEPCGCQIAKNLLGVFDLAVEFVQLTDPSRFDRFRSLGDVPDVTYGSHAT